MPEDRAKSGGSSSSSSRREGGSSRSSKADGASRSNSKRSTSSSSHSSSKPSKPSNPKDIFSLAIKQREQDRREGGDEERSLVIVGSKQGGKTSLILRFLDRGRDVPKPTTALEYTYGRKSRSGDTGKDVVHIWELGGGSSLANLVETPITAQALRTLSFVLALDLSQPERLWDTADVLLKGIRKRLDRVLGDLTTKQSRLPGHLKSKSWQKYGEDHPDKELLQPLPVPLLIVGTKYDVFQNRDSGERKLVCKTLRFLAHLHGASLLFVSDKDEGLMNRCRAHFAHLAFKTANPGRSVSLDHSKPLIVPAGSDTLGQIGAPPVGADASSIGARHPQDLWKAAFCEMFPPAAEEGAGKGAGDSAIDPAQNPEYAEPAVDTMRAQKDEELARYRRHSERRAREASKRSKAAKS